MSMRIKRMQAALKKLQRCVTDDRIHVELINEDDLTSWFVTLMYRSNNGSGGQGCEEGLRVQLNVQFFPQDGKLPRIAILRPMLSAVFIHNGVVCLTDFGFEGFCYDATDLVALVETIYFKLTPAPEGSVVVENPIGFFTSDDHAKGEKVIEAGHPQWVRMTNSKHEKQTNNDTEQGERHFAAAEDEVAFEQIELCSTTRNIASLIENTSSPTHFVVTGDVEVGRPVTITAAMNVRFTSSAAGHPAKLGLSLFLDAQAGSISATFEDIEWSTPFSTHPIVTASGKVLLQCSRVKVCGQVIVERGASCSFSGCNLSAGSSPVMQVNDEGSTLRLGDQSTLSSHNDEIGVACDCGGHVDIKDSTVERMIDVGSATAQLVSCTVKVPQGGKHGVKVNHGTVTASNCAFSGVEESDLGIASLLMGKVLCDNCTFRGFSKAIEGSSGGLLEVTACSAHDTNCAFFFHESVATVSGCSFSNVQFAILSKQGSSVKASECSAETARPDSVAYKSELASRLAVDSSTANGFRVAFQASKDKAIAVLRHCKATKAQFGYTGLASSKVELVKCHAKETNNAVTIDGSQGTLTDCELEGRAVGVYCLNGGQCTVGGTAIEHHRFGTEVSGKDSRLIVRDTKISQRSETSTEDIGMFARDGSSLEAKCCEILSGTTKSSGIQASASSSICAEECTASGCQFGYIGLASSKVELVKCHAKETNNAVTIDGSQGTLTDCELEGRAVGVYCLNGGQCTVGGTAIEHHRFGIESSRESSLVTATSCTIRFVGGNVTENDGCMARQGGHIVLSKSKITSERLTQHSSAIYVTDGGCVDISEVVVTPHSYDYGLHAVKRSKLNATKATVECCRVAVVVKNESTVQLAESRVVGRPCALQGTDVAVIKVEQCTVDGQLESFENSSVELGQNVNASGPRVGF